MWCGTFIGVNNVAQQMGIITKVSNMFFNHDGCYSVPLPISMNHLPCLYRFQKQGDSNCQAVWQFVIKGQMPDYGATKVIGSMPIKGWHEDDQQQKYHAKQNKSKPRPPNTKNKRAK
jgi:hypothetical protein